MVGVTIEILFGIPFLGLHGRGPLADLLHHEVRDTAIHITAVQPVPRPAVEVSKPAPAFDSRFSIFDLFLLLWIPGQLLWATVKWIRSDVARDTDPALLDAPSAS